MTQVRAKKFLSAKEMRFDQRATIDPNGVLSSPLFYFDALSRTDWRDLYTFHPDGTETTSLRTATRIAITGYWYPYSSPPFNPDFYPALGLSPSVVVRNAFEIDGDFSGSLTSWQQASARPITALRQYAQWENRQAGVAGEILLATIQVENLSIQGYETSPITIWNSGNDSAIGSLNDDRFIGSAGSDSLSGGKGDDLLHGDGRSLWLSTGRAVPADILALPDGVDTLTGGQGNDRLFGGDGIDIAVFQGLSNEYWISGLGTNSIQITDRIANRDGNDLLDTIEIIEFSNLSLKLSTSIAAQRISQTALDRITELYLAFFNRIPDADGLAYWIGQYAAGQTINQIAEYFYNAGVSHSDLTGYRPGMGNEEFVNIVYRNVLGRPGGADPEGLQHWTTLLASGTPKGALVAAVLDAAYGPEFGFADHPYRWVQQLLVNKLAVAKQIAVGWGVNYSSPGESISRGVAIAQAVTATDTTAALALVGINLSEAQSQNIF